MTIGHNHDKINIEEKLHMTEKEIKLSFLEPTTEKELEVVVKESQLQEFRLYDITHSVRYKHNQFLEADVVGEFIIKLADLTSDILDKITSGYSLEEISIYEDNKLIYDVSVRLNLKPKTTIKDNVLEISQFQ